MAIKTSPAMKDPSLAWLNGDWGADPGALGNYAAAHPGFTGVAPTGSAVNPTPYTQITQPGFTPDYKSLIQNDPGYQIALDQLNPQGIAAGTQRDASIRQAYAQAGVPFDPAQAAAVLGLDPGTLASIIDPTTQALAQQNTAAGLSTEGRIQRQQEIATRTLRNQLAARGALSSGENVYQSGLLNQSYAQQQDDALQALLKAIGGYQGQYLTAQQQIADQLANAASSAATTQEGLPQNQPHGAQSFSYDPGTGKYTGAGGATWTPHQAADGSWVVVDDSTGTAYSLGSDGTLGATTTYTPPASTTGTGGGGASTSTSTSTSTGGATTGGGSSSATTSTGGDSGTTTKVGGLLGGQSTPVASGPNVVPPPRRVGPAMAV